MKYLSRAESADYIGVTKAMLKDLIKWGHITETREGIPASSLEGYWKTSPAPEPFGF